MALRMRAATAALALAALAGSASAAIRINEIRVDNPGGDINEYFELSGTPGESLSNLWYIVIGDAGSPGLSGVVEAVIPLSGTIPSDGYFLASENTNTIDPGEIDLDLGASGLNFENDDNYTHLLVSGWTGVLNADLDATNDGILDSTPWVSIVDQVAFTGEGTDQIYSSIVVGPDPIKGSPWHLYRFPNGTGAWLFDSLDNGATTAQTDAANYTTDTPGTANIPAPGAMALIGLGGLLAARRRR